MITTSGFGLLFIVCACSILATRKDLQTWVALPENHRVLKPPTYHKLAIFGLPISLAALLFSFAAQAAATLAQRLLYGAGVFILCGSAGVFLMRLLRKEPKGAE